VQGWKNGDLEIGERVETGETVTLTLKENPNVTK